MQRVCHESEKTEAGFSHPSGEMCCVLAQLIRCYSAAVKLAEHCLTQQFLITRSPPVAQKPSQVCKGKRERELTNSLI